MSIYFFKYALQKVRLIKNIDLNKSTLNEKSFCKEIKILCVHIIANCNGNQFHFFHINSKAVLKFSIINYCETFLSVE